MPYIEREGGNVVGLLRWPRTENQERLADDHADVVGYRVGGAKREALAEVKAAAVAKVADLDSSISKTVAREAVLPFKTQFQAATTEAEVETVRATAIAAVEAL